MSPNPPEKVIERYDWCDAAQKHLPVYKEPVVKTSDIRCYILADSKLPPIHAGIQSAHALAELVHFQQSVPILKDWVENHKTLVLLGATPEQMSDMKKYFDKIGRKYASFLEPDLDNMETAIAFEPMDSVEGKIVFGKFKLFK